MDAPDVLLILDTETGGLDPAVHPLLEIGAVRWSIKNSCLLESWSTLVQAKENLAERVNHIPLAAVRDALPPADAFRLVDEIAARSDVIVAHSAEFDRGFLPELGKPWVCSKFDLKWPNVDIDGESLVKIAVQNGVGVTHAHRALTDCLILSRLFERMVETGHDVGAMIQRGLRPKATFLSLAPFAEKDVVKAAGFKWQPEIKQWVRTMAIEDTATLPFKVHQLEGKG